MYEHMVGMSLVPDAVANWHDYLQHGWKKYPAGVDNAQLRLGQLYQSKVLIPANCYGMHNGRAFPFTALCPVWNINSVSECTFDFGACGAVMQKDGDARQAWMPYKSSPPVYQDDQVDWRDNLDDEYGVIFIRAVKNRNREDEVKRLRGLVHSFYLKYRDLTYTCTDRYEIYVNNRLLVPDTFKTKDEAYAYLDGMHGMRRGDEHLMPIVVYTPKWGKKQISHCADERYCLRSIKSILYWRSNMLSDEEFSHIDDLYWNNREEYKELSEDIRNEYMHMTYMYDNEEWYWDNEEWYWRELCCTSIEYSYLTGNQSQE